jgi:AraC family transcriptional regulator
MDGEFDWTIEAAQQVRGLRLAVMTHASTGPLTRTHCMPADTVCLFLTPSPRGATGGFGTAPRRFDRCGRMVVTPAGVPLQARIPGSPPRRLVNCIWEGAIEDDPLNPAGTWDGDWERVQQACLDLRDAAAERLLQRMADEVTAPGFASALLLEGLGLTLRADIARHVRRAAAPAAGGLAPWQLRRIDELARGDTGSNLADFAAACQVSARHLMRAFRHSTGRTVMSHVQAMRLERAQTMLADSALPVAEIAAAAGFATPSAFSAAFRRVAGCTPSAYRARRRS